MGEEPEPAPVEEPDEAEEQECSGDDKVDQDEPAPQPSPPDDQPISAEDLENTYNAQVEDDKAEEPAKESAPVDGIVHDNWANDDDDSDPEDHTVEPVHESPPPQRPEEDAPPKESVLGKDPPIKDNYREGDRPTRKPRGRGARGGRPYRKHHGGYPARRARGGNYHGDYKQHYDKPRGGRYQDRGRYDQEEPPSKGKKIDQDGFEIIEKRPFVKKQGRRGKPFRKEDPAKPKDKNTKPDQ